MTCRHPSLGEQLGPWRGDLVSVPNQYKVNRVKKTAHKLPTAERDVRGAASFVVVATVVLVIVRQSWPFGSGRLALIQPARYLTLREQDPGRSEIQQSRIWVWRMR